MPAGRNRAARQEFYLHKVKEKWILFPEPGLFLNGHQVREETALEVGDIIFWPFMTIRFVEEDIFLISSEEHFQTELACIEQPMSEMKKNYPQYRRTPRMNYELPEETITTILGRYGIDCNRPIMTQVSRFDPWKDPLGVIDTYRIVKSQVPDLQLVMVASMAHDDPEGWSYFERTARHAGNDYDIFLLSNLNGVGNVEVNAIQRAANVITQKSLREGFGLTVTEGLWKNKPVIAGNVGGIPTQILDGRTGYLVNSVTEAADRAIEVLTDFNLATSLGASGHEHVRTNFLTTTNLKRYLELMNSLSSQARISSRSAGSMRSTTSGPETG
jgi:glycosyltransferase involved in cell wall biosynthesis